MQRTISSSNLDQVERVKQRIIDDRKDAPAPNAVPYFDVFTAFSFVVPLSELDREPRGVRDAVLEGVLDQGMQKRLEVEEKIINWERSCMHLSCLKTLGDGNCLMHSASLAMWGIHDRDLILRSAVFSAFTHSKSRALFDRWQSDRRNELRQLDASMDPHIWDAEYQQIVDMVNPRKPGGRMDSLTDFHIFILCNVLRRPIIVYGTARVHSISTGASFGPNNIPGVYLPLLWTTDCILKDPLMLAYVGSHFSALVPCDKHHGNIPPAIPLCDQHGRILPVKFLLPNEVNAEDAYRRDYMCVSTIRHSSGSIPVAQLNIRDQPEILRQFWRNHVERNKKSSSVPRPRELNPDRHHAPSYDTGSSSNSARCVQCNTPGARPDTYYLCRECYQQQVQLAGGESGGHRPPPPQDNFNQQNSPPESLPQPITQLHQRQKPRDHYGSPPMDHQRDERAAEKCKNPKCDMFGSREKNGYCSTCYKHYGSGGPNQQRMVENQGKRRNTCIQCHLEEAVEGYGNLCRVCHGRNMHGQHVYNPDVKSSQGSAMIQYNDYGDDKYDRREPVGRREDKHSGGKAKRCTFGNCERMPDPASEEKLCSEHFFEALDGKLPGFSPSQLLQGDIQPAPGNRPGGPRPRDMGYEDPQYRSDLPDPMMNRPKPLPRKQNSASGGRRSPDNLGPEIDKLDITGRMVDVSTQKCFMCMGVDPRDNPYGVFVCTKHARDVHRTMVLKVKEPLGGGSGYRHTYDHGQRDYPQDKPTAAPRTGASNYRDHYDEGQGGYQNRNPSPSGRTGASNYSDPYGGGKGRYPDGNPSPSPHTRGSNYSDQHNTGRSGRSDTNPPSATPDGKLCATPGCSNYRIEKQNNVYCDDCIQALLHSSGQNIPEDQQCKDPTCRRRKAPHRMGYCETCYELRYLVGDQDPY
jgi:hypothetical protein